MAGIYIHVPFCKQLCYYCDFYFSVSLRRKQEMLQALKQELVMRSSEFEGIKVNTLYMGGGTPTVYTPHELGELVKVAKENYNANEIAELTVEANPDDLSASYLEGLLKIGVNRLSIGIQSFIDRDLKWMNRRHSAQQAENSVRLAQRVGFSNISVDLIYGIPGMTISEWKANVDKVVELNVPHFSAYHLGIEAKTIFGRQLDKGLLEVVDEEFSTEQFVLLKQITELAGFEHYEISNFAKQGQYGVHNTAYWQQKPYLGIGPSAHSYNGHSRRWNLSNNTRYLARLSRREPFFEQEQLSKTMIFNEYLLTSLRTKWGASLELIKSKFGEPYFGYLLSKIRHSEGNKMLVIEGEWLKIPTNLFLLSDSIISKLFFVD